MYLYDSSTIVDRRLEELLKSSGWRHRWSKWNYFGFSIRLHRPSGHANVLYGPQLIQLNSLASWISGNAGMIAMREVTRRLGQRLYEVIKSGAVKRATACIDFNKKF